MLAGLWCLILGPTRNLDLTSSFSLGWYDNEFFQTISVFEQSSLSSVATLLLELYCVIVIKHVTFFTICAKLLVTVAFTFTLFGWNCSFGFEQNYWRIDGFGEKKGTDRRICIPLFTHSLWGQSLIYLGNLWGQLWPSDHVFPHKGMELGNVCISKMVYETTFIRFCHQKESTCQQHP